MLSIALAAAQPDDDAPKAADNEELSQRPTLRRGELLEVVPGMIITQHAGGGKANQYFLRGYNLHHCNDFRLTQRHADQCPDPRPRLGLRRPQLHDP